MLVSKIRGVVAGDAKTYDLLKSYTKFIALQATCDISVRFIGPLEYQLTRFKAGEALAVEAGLIPL
jgi:hypothetical protein